MLIIKPLSRRKLDVLEANPTAAATVRDYAPEAKWPPTNVDTVNVYMDLMGVPNNLLVDKDEEYTERYYTMLNEAIDMPFRELVQKIANVASFRALQRQQARRQRWEDAANANIDEVFAGWPAPFGCAPSQYEYLLIASPVWRSTVGVLVAVPWALDRLPPVVLGRMWNHIYEADRMNLRGNMPAPDPADLPPSLRPYASLVPVLASEAADAQSFKQWGGGGYKTKEQKVQEAQQRQQRKTVAERALAPLLDRLESLDARSELPPEVMRALDARPSTLSLYAWFNECQLATALNIAFGQNAAAAASRTALAILSAAIFPGAESTTEGKRRRIETAGPRTATPSTLQALARTQLARPTGVPVDWSIVPPLLYDTVGFDVWRGACGVAPMTAPVDEVTQYAPLVDVARAWDIEPDEAESIQPALLCGRLASEAITRGIPHGARLAPRAWQRTGRPVLTWSEIDALEAVCGVDRNLLFERADAERIDALVHKAFKQAYARKPTEADAPFLATVTTLVKRANALHGVEASDVDAAPLDVRLQIDLAMAALRSGVPLVPDDLANAGSACVALTPTAALAP